MTSHLEIRFPARALRTNNAALDLALSAEAFCEALQSALAMHLPAVSSVVHVDENASGMKVTVVAGDDTLARAIEREAEDLIWVVRQCDAWTRMVAP